MQGDFDGWIPVNESWTYASADAPIFTFTVAGDKTIKYSPGMKINLTQSSVIAYFVIVAVSYSSPNTTITVYGGTDYTLANSTISLPYYSMQKAPFGFPLNPSKWTVEVSDTTQRIQSSPTQNTWYNLGSVSITIPIGIWRVYYNVLIETDRLSEGNLNTYVTLSTANNSESDNDFTARIADNNLVTNSVDQVIGANQTREKIVNLSSKTTYYINTKIDQTGIDSTYNNNQISKLFIRAICVYL